MLDFYSYDTTRSKNFLIISSNNILTYKKSFILCSIHWFLSTNFRSLQCYFLFICGAQARLFFVYFWSINWVTTRFKFLHPSERLSPHIIMDTKLRAPLKPLKHYENIIPKGLRGALNWVPIMQRGASLLDNTSGRGYESLNTKVRKVAIYKSCI